MVLNVTSVVFVDISIYADNAVVFVNLSLLAHCWNVPFPVFGCFHIMLNMFMITSERFFLFLLLRS